MLACCSVLGTWQPKMDISWLLSMLALMTGGAVPGGPMADEFLIGEVATLFMAGFETTGAPLYQRPALSFFTFSTYIIGWDTRRLSM